MCRRFEVHSDTDHITLQQGDLDVAPFYAPAYYDDRLQTKPEVSFRLNAN